MYRTGSILKLILVSIIFLNCFGCNTKSRVENKFIGIWDWQRDDNMEVLIEFTSKKQMLTITDKGILPPLYWEIDTKTETIAFCGDDGTPVDKWRYKFKQNKLILYNVYNEGEWVLVSREK